MTSFTSSGSVTTNYAYRPDGLRVQKAVSGGNSTSFAYDGQMGFEDVDAGSSPAVTDYAIGARGLDRLAKTVSGSTTVAYPIFDGHGNMVCTLSASSGSYSTSNARGFDAWGNILNSDGSGDPKGRYCASLGHKQDDESGLTYMRARYYDPAGGRFITSDLNHQGTNWFAYANEDPINMADKTGKTGEWLGAYLVADLISLIGTYLCAEKMIGAWVEEAEAWEILAWAGATAVALTLAIWSGANTFKSLTDIVNSLSYHAALAGDGDAVIAMCEKARSCAAIAPLVYVAECYAYLGEIDSGE